MKFPKVFSRLSAPAPVAPAPRASFDAAKARRRLSLWKADASSLRALMASEGPLMLRRCRDVMQNNPYAAGAIDVFVANMVGAGVKPSSLMTENPALRDQIQQLWLQWTDACDADGLVDFYGMQAVIARALFEAGEIFVRLRPRRPEDGLSVPLQLQMLEAEMLDHAFCEVLASGNQVISGVEFDLIGRRVAYWFWRQHPGDNLQVGRPASDLRVRVPAESVLHIMRVLRPGQVRGVPMISPAVVKLWLLDQYDDAELDRKKTAALFAGFITSPQPEDIIEPDGDATAPDGTVTLEPGTMHTLLPGEDIKFSDPAEVGGSYEAFQYRALLSVFTAMGVPYTIGTGDLKRANYSSLRGALVEFRRRVTQLQHHTLVFQLARPVWNAWIDAAVLSGALTIPGYAASPAPARAVKWIPPKFEWVDPLKDRKAEAIAVQYGFKARSDVIEEEGYDPEETDRRIAADAQRALDMGIIISNQPVPLNEEQADQMSEAADAGGELDTAA